MSWSSFIMPKIANYAIIFKPFCNGHNLEVYKVILLENNLTRLLAIVNKMTIRR